MSQGFEYAVDIVLCIDKTGSMAPVIDKVKAKALSFDKELKAVLDEKGKIVNAFRVRVIAFGDIYHDKDAWVTESPFYNLPSEASSFKDFVNRLRPEGGGDEPESGLEAVAMAINSAWTSSGHRRRHVIVVWTDASAHPLERRAEQGGEIGPSLPPNMDGFKDLWDSQAINQNSRRLVLFAPESYPWSDIATEFSEAYLFPSRAGNGMEERDFSEILSLIASSIS